MMAETYQHSGRVGAMGIPMMVIGGCVTAVVLGVVYAYGLAWIPLIYASFFLTAALGAGIGLVVGFCGKVGKVRSPNLIGIFGILSGLLGLATAWSFDALAKFPDTFKDPLLQYEQIQAWMEFCYTEGTWGIGRQGTAVTGPFLAAVWVIEAIAVLGLAYVTSKVVTGSTPFCEHCMSWTESEDDFARLFPPEDNNIALESLCAGDVNVINQFKKAPHSAGAYIRLDLARCPDCDQCSCLSVALAEVSVDKNGDNQINTSMLAQHLIIPGSDFDKLKEDVRQLEMATFDTESDAQEDVEDDSEEA